MANYLGVDVGHKRIGLSTGSDDLMIALPIEAIVSLDREASIDRVAQVIGDMRISVVVFGYPFNMDGSIGAMGEYVDFFMNELKKQVRDSVVFVKSDERLTSFQINVNMHMGNNLKFESVRRKMKNRRKGFIDSKAAAIILQDYFDEMSIKKALR